MCRATENIILPNKDLCYAGTKAIGIYAQIATIYGLGKLENITR